MNQYIAFVDGRNIKIPYRAATSLRLLTLSKSSRLSLKSRHHNGHIREEAIKALLSRPLASAEVPYVFLALADYLSEINILPTRSNKDIKLVMHKFVQENGTLVMLVETKIISYWNEFYKNSYPTYAEYPPYKYLQSLK